MQKIKNIIKLLLFMLRGRVFYHDTAVLAKSDILAGKNILITGGSSGYGYSIAEQLSRQGAKVIITGRNEDRLNYAAEKLGRDRAFPLAWDFNDSQLTAKIIEDAELLVGGKLFAFVNNAGITRLKNHFTEEDWDAILGTNTYSLFSVLNIEYNYLKSIGGGKIINITSNACITSIFHPYYISKTEAVSITELMAKGSIKDNIRVNSVAPGVAITNINPKLKTMLGDSGNVYFGGSKNKRYTLVEDVANLVLFMIMPNGDGLNGQNIIVDGGMSLS